MNVEIKKKKSKSMKEVFVKGLKFHFIFYKNYEYYITPCIAYSRRNESFGTEIVFGFLNLRMSIYFHNKKVKK